MTDPDSPRDKNLCHQSRVLTRQSVWYAIMGQGEISQGKWHWVASRSSSSVKSYLVTCKSHVRVIYPLTFQWMSPGQIVKTISLKNIWGWKTSVDTTSEHVEEFQVFMSQISCGNCNSKQQISVAKIMFWPSLRGIEITRWIPRIWWQSAYTFLMIQHSANINPVTFFTSSASTWCDKLIIIIQLGVHHHLDGVLIQVLCWIIMG